MKVVVVNDHLYPDGGADMVALLSADALSQLGVEVTLFAADRPRPDDTVARPYAVVCTGQMDLAHDPNPVRVGAQGLWNPAAARGLRELLAGFDPASTIVHVHSWTKALSSSVFRAAQDAGFPVVCTLHDYFSVCPNGTLFNGQTRRICELRPLSVACVASHCDPRAYTHKLYRVARHAVQQRFGGFPKSVDQFVAISSFSERVIGQYLPADTRYAQVRNPIDVGAQPTPADPGASRSFVMVARMFAPKGWELFLEACERAGVEALAVGDGVDRAALEQRFPRARFVGQLDREGVNAAMRSARALVMPSLWYETQGLVIAEAAAQGVPAIVADTCGGAETVLPDESGLLFRQGSVDALTEAIRHLADDDALARRLGHGAAERFWSNPPTPAGHGRELIAVYEQVLARKASSATAAAAPR
ncbi:MAG: glycosyltransferase [Caldimonas sp.]